MKKWLWMIILTGLIVLLAGCGASDTVSEQVVRVTPASPAEGQAPSNTLPPTAATPVAALTTKDVQRITLADAKSLLDNGTAVLYDARSARAYSSKHAAGAISLPEAEVAARFSELPTDKSLIFYCTWPAEQDSARAALYAIQQGMDPAKVFALVGGLAVWDNAGYPMEWP